jgi:hypothetical protein
VYPTKQKVIINVIIDDNMFMKISILSLSSLVLLLLFFNQDIKADNDDMNLLTKINVVSSLFNNTDMNQNIENQYIVVLNSTISNQTFNFLIDNLTEKGVKIIAIYDQPILKGFTFVSSNITLTKNILEFLNNQTYVDYVKQDKEARIFR